MLTTIVKGRATGKTQQVIEMMYEDENAIVIIPTRNQKAIYPVELHSRIYTGKDMMWRGKKISRIILDEGFMYDKEILAHLYYNLGAKGQEVISIGTITENENVEVKTNEKLFGNQYFDKVTKIAELKTEMRALSKLRENLLKECKDAEAIVIMNVIRRYDEMLKELS